MFQSRVLVVLVLAFVSIFQIGCDLLNDTDPLANEVKDFVKNVRPEVRFQPILIPVEFVINRDGIDVGAGKGFTTPIGRVEIGAQLPVYTVENDDDLILILRNFSSGLDEVYHLWHGQQMDIVVENARISVSGNTVTIEVNEGNIVWLQPKQSVTARMPGVQGVLPDHFCEGSFNTRLAGHTRARIAVIQAYVHREPGENAPLVPAEVLRGGREVAIIGGPKCFERGRWWQIQSDLITLSDGSQAVITGWIVEESGDEWLLEPIQ